MSPDLLALFEPSADALFDLLRERIDNSMLREIAGNDVPFRTDANLKALIPIRRTGKIPAPLEWEPKEVLELTKWTEPDDLELNDEVDHDPVRGHIIRAFACAALLKAGADPENDGRLPGEIDTLVQLLSSALVLERDVQNATARLIAWRLAKHRKDRNDEENPPFFELALFLLALFSGDPPWIESILELLVDSVVATELKTRQEIDQNSARHGIKHQARWMIGLTDSDQKLENWESLARKARSVASRLQSDAARRKVDFVCDLLLSEATV